MAPDGKSPSRASRRTPRGRSSVKIISGGQTGVDRAALDVALQLGIPAGGWCPRGRRAEDGTIPAKYPLQEAPSPYYRHRTRLNVQHSDGTLILARGPLTGGTRQTRLDAQALGKPFLVVRLDKSPSSEEVLRWLLEQKIRVLNVAGPRESTSPGIAQQARRFLRPLLKKWLEHLAQRSSADG